MTGSGSDTASLIGKMATHADGDTGAIVEVSESWPNEYWFHIEIAEKVILMDQRKNFRVEGENNLIRNDRVVVTGNDEFTGCHGIVKRIEYSTNNVNILVHLDNYPKKEDEWFAFSADDLMLE